MNRRGFMAISSAAFLFNSRAMASDNVEIPMYTSSNARWQAAYDKAIEIVNNNIQIIPRYSKPVLIEGATYQGIWMECGPHEALVYRKFRPDIAKNSHMCFFELQRADGQLPANNKITETGFGQIQMVIPIASTAWELAKATGDSELLNSAYTSCALWDNWLRKYRNTRGTGLTEGFCTYDTGHDNSPRWEGVPPQCPNKDAKHFNSGYALPRLSPDLSATTYSARIALANMAKALGKNNEADMWQEDAVKIKSLILSKLYSEEDAAFYDLDIENKFIKVNSDILTRMCSEHIPDKKMFETLWQRQLYNKNAFWTPYPLPSIAYNDPKFVHTIPPNSWGGAAQALTALRASRWFDFYGKSSEFNIMMDAWCEAIQKDMSFRQQMDPITGVFTLNDAPNYSPAALVMIDYTWRLAGVCEAADTLEWNINIGHPASLNAKFNIVTDNGKQVAIMYENKAAKLFFNNREFLRIEGGSVKLITDKNGNLKRLIGFSLKRQKIVLNSMGNRQTIRIEPNQIIEI